MNKKKMRNPLQKRVPKELIGEWRKYLVLFLLLAITIGFVSGMYVANSSMLKAIDASVTKYDLEDGHFELNRKADEELLKKLETGEQSDVWAYATDEARKEVDREIEKRSREQAEEQAENLLKENVKALVDPQTMPEAYEEALKKAREESEGKVHFPLQILPWLHLCYSTFPSPS